MSVRVWSTRDARPADFDAAWRACLRDSGHAHFAMEPDLLEWEAHHGHHAQALLIEDGSRRVALVLREAALGWESGWPWRWQVAFGAPAHDGPAGMTAAAARWLFTRLSELRDWRRLELNLPFPPPDGVKARRAGATIVLPLNRTEEDLHRGMSGNKRREVKKAQQNGFEVVEAATHEEYRAFHRLQLLGKRPAGAPGAVRAPEAPAFGEHWREWELPWMWLLVAKHEGRVVAGSGFGRSEGGVLDYRANASTPQARSQFANALLAWEAMRRGRALGYRYVNWGGATTFKRGLGGERLETWCWLGGGRAWALPNIIAASIDRARPKVAERVKRAGRALSEGRGKPPRV